MITTVVKNKYIIVIILKVGNILKYFKILKNIHIMN